MSPRLVRQCVRESRKLVILLLLPPVRVQRLKKLVKSEFYITIVRYLSIYSVLLPLGNLLYHKARSTRVTNLMLTLCAVSLFSDLLLQILASHSLNNFPVINIFLFAQFAILFSIFAEKEKSKFIFVLFIFLIFFNAVDFLILHSPGTFNSYSAYSNGLFMTVLSLRGMYGLIKEMNSKKIQSLPFFWLFFGVLLYYAGTIFLFLFNNYLVEYFSTNYASIWVLHNLLNTSKNLLFFVTTWKIFGT